MIASGHIFRVMLASLVAFWLPMQCCAIAAASFGEAGRVTAPEAAPPHCERPCCTPETPAQSQEEEPCECDSRAALSRAAVIDGGRLGMDVFGTGGFFFALPPLPAALACLAGGSEAHLSHIDPGPTSAPAVTLRALSVLLTV